MGKTLKEEDLRLNIIVNGDPARKEIGQLTRSTKDLRSENGRLLAEQKKLTAAGGENKARIAEITTTIKKNNETIKTNEIRTKQLRSEIKLTSMTTAELIQRHAELRNVMRNVVPGTPQWKQLQIEMRAVSVRMAQLRTETIATEGVMCRMASNVNKYIGTATAAFAAFAMYGSGLYKSIQAYSGLDEAMSNARKTTNMTRKEVEELNAKLAKIDTRTAQNDLLSLARIGGKLGIAKRDIEGFTRAADVIKIALGRDLGDNVETTIGQIGKLVNVFQLNKEFGIEQGMMKTAAAVNELGKSSTANEANIVEFMRRVGGVGHSANISLANIAGLGATLDDLGQTMEVAGTSMSQVITGMFRRTDAFAAAAKMSVKDFKKLMTEDMNEALIRMAEGMGSDGAAMGKIVAALDSLKLDGTRATGVLTALAQNTGKLREQQEIANRAFDEGTSCMKEFNIMNSSTEAVTEKKKKQITAEAVALGKSLIPAYHESLSAQASLIKGTRILIEWLIQNRGAIVGLVASYAAYKGVILATNTAKKAYAATVVGLRGIKLSYLLAVRATTAATVTGTGVTKAATIATRLFSMALKTTPLGWAAVAIGAVVGAFTYFTTRANSATSAQRTFNEITKAAAEIEDEHGVNLVGKAEKMTQLMRVVENEATSEEHRTAAIKELQELMPDGIDLINQETIANGEAAKSVKAYTDQLILQATIKAALQKKQDLIDQAGKDRLDGDDKKVGWFKRGILAYATVQSRGIFKYNTLVGVAEEKNKKDYQANLDKQLTDIDKIIAEAQAELNAKKLIVPAPEVTASGDTTVPDTSTNDDFGGRGSQKTWSLDNDANFLAAKKKLRQKFADGEISTERAYQGKLLSLEIAALKARLVANKESGVDRSKLEIQLTDKLFEQKKNESEIAEADFETEKQKLRKQFADGEIATEQEYQDKLLSLEIAFLKTRLASNKDTGETRVKLEAQLNDKLIEQKKREQQQADAAEDLRIQNMTNATERENAEYERKKRQYAGNTVAMEHLAAAHNRNLAIIDLQRATSALKQEEAEYKQSRQIMLERHKIELQTANRTKGERARLKQEQYNELKAFDEEYFRNALAQLQSLNTEGVMSFRDLKGILQTIDLDTSLLSEEEKNDIIRRIKEVMAAMNAAQQPVGKSGYSFSQGKGGSLFGFSQDDWSLFFENIGNGKFGVKEMEMALLAAAEAANMAMDVYSSYDKMMTAKENAELKKYKKTNDVKKKTMQNRLDAGLMSQEQYNAEVERMEADYEKKQEEAQIKQAKRQKTQSIIQATINTAVAVVKTLSEWGLPWGLIPAGIMAAMGAAQIAMIAATPIAGAEVGGFAVERTQDGKRYNAQVSPNARGYIDRPTVLVGENGMEYVIPAEAMQNPTAAPIINTFETVRQKGRLRDFDFSQILPCMIHTHGYASGGMPTGTMPSSVTFPTAATPENKALLQVLMKLVTILGTPLKADVSLMGRGGLLERMHDYERIKNRGKIG
ncbi:MAG: phage tail tape measure protein [Alistipes sp.]